MPQAVARAGASVPVQGINPSLDLQALVAGLAEAIAPTQTTHGERPLFRCNSAEFALAVELGAVLSRLEHLLHNNKKYAALLDGDTGFVQHYMPPAHGQQVWYGSRTTEGSELALKKAVQKLVENIDAAWQHTLHNAKLSAHDFLIKDPSTHMAMLAQAVDGNPIELANVVKLNPVRLDAAAKQALPNKAKGRAITSVETLSGSRADHLDSVIKGCAQILADEDVDDAEIQKRCQALRESTERDIAALESRATHDLNRFLNFLEDDALARVRLAMCFELLAHLSDYSQQHRSTNVSTRLFVSYAKRCQTFYRLLTNPPITQPETMRLTCDFSRVVEGATFNLTEEACKALFYDALPIFPQPDTQIFEQTGHDYVSREVSYRFKINGLNHREGKTAFAARLDKVCAFFAKGNMQQAVSAVKANLKALILWWAVLPRLAEDIDEHDEAALAQEVQQRIVECLNAVQQRGLAGVQAMLATLQDAEQDNAIFKTAADELVQAMRNTGSALQQQQFAFYLNILRDLINEDDLLGAISSKVLSSPDIKTHDQYQIHFFQNLRVTQHTPLASHQVLFSLRVAVWLDESYLIADAPHTLLQATRLPPESLVSIIWQPLLGQAEEGSKKQVELYSSFLQPRRIVLRYNAVGLNSPARTEARTAPNPTGLAQVFQKSAICRTAFTILSYVVAMRVLHHITASVSQKPTVHMLRLQTEQRHASANATTSDNVYAASQAVERLLNRDYNCRLQGLVALDNHDFKYRKRSTLYALCAGLPLQLSSSQARHPTPFQKIAVMTLTSRFSDMHPTIAEPNPSQCGYVVMLRSYVLTYEPTSHHYQLAHDTTRVSTVEAEDRAQQPQVIHEQLRQFQDAGIQHIVYIVHRYGERHRGRSQQRQRWHDEPNFLNSLYDDFPQLIIYPLVRDVFPIARLKSDRTYATDGAYEIVAAGLQGYRLPAGFDRLRANFTPIYSLGTLRIVGSTDEDAQNKKPQSGICTYFLLSDVRPKDEQRMQLIRSNLLLDELEGNILQQRTDLLMALRGIHLLESEEKPYKGQLRPVLDPYRWISPDTLENTGDIVIAHSRRNAKAAILSLPAVLARISDVLHGLDDVKS